MGKTVLDSMFNKFKEKDNIVVSSNLLKPLVFYMNDNFLRCSETNKYLCCFSLNRLCCGGSPIFTITILIIFSHNLIVNSIIVSRCRKYFY